MVASLGGMTHLHRLCLITGSVARNILARNLLGKLADKSFVSARCDWVLPTAVVRGREDAEKWLQLIDDKGQPTAGMTTLLDQEPHVLSASLTTF